MKKVFQTERYKQYAMGKALRDLEWKRKWKRKKRKGNTDSSLRLAKSRRRLSSKHKTITVPAKFSLVENPDETLRFFEEVNGYVKNNVSVRLDLQNVVFLTPDALLYLVASLDYYRQKKTLYNISGNLPKEQRCRTLFMDSGFLNYVHSKFKQEHKNTGILSISKHSLVEGSLAKNILDFCLKHLGQNKDKQSRDVYRMLVELMNNTRDHAYPEDREGLRWYMMAIYDTDKARMTVSFLDTGVGIPTTIKKNFSEKFRDMIGTPQHNILVRSALEGEFRTRTQEGYRGKGLPSIYKCFQEGSMQNLTIVSKRAFLNLTSGPECDLNVALRGSLYSWTMS